MARYSPAVIEKLVEEITHQVLSRLNTQPAATGPGCNCRDGSCVQHCADQVQQVMQAGATRVTAPLGARSSQAAVNSLIDHTLLKPDASQDQIAQLCYEARKYTFASVCVNPVHVPLAAQLLKGSPVKVCTVVGFPLGATPATVKAYEAQQAIRDGATEIDMVINVGALKSQDYRAVYDDVAAVVRTSQAGHALVKVIIETALLTDEEKVVACQIAKAAGANFVKTSTGFGPGGATVADVQLMRQVVGSEMGVKASGGVRNYQDAQAMIAAGATRLGASAGVRIVQEAQR